jgi:hypothetical protein
MYVIVSSVTQFYGNSSRQYSLTANLHAVLAQYDTTQTGFQCYVEDTN